MEVQILAVSSPICLTVLHPQVGMTRVEVDPRGFVRLEHQWKDNLQIQYQFTAEEAQAVGNHLCERAAFAEMEPMNQHNRPATVKTGSTVNRIWHLGGSVLFAQVDLDVSPSGRPNQAVEFSSAGAVSVGSSLCNAAARLRYQQQLGCIKPQEYRAAAA